MKKSYILPRVIAEVATLAARRSHQSLSVKARRISAYFLEFNTSDPAVFLSTKRSLNLNKCYRRTFKRILGKRLRVNSRKHIMDGNLNIERKMKKCQLLNQKSQKHFIKHF
jgi:hypothetical protein